MSIPPVSHRPVSNHSTRDPSAADQAVVELARAAGLAVDWVDASGTPRRVELESLRRILAALGLPAATASEVAESRALLRTETGLPPLLTLQVGDPLVLPVGAMPENSTAELTLETGDVLPVQFSVRGRRAIGPSVQAIGYHRLRLGGREITLAVAPPRCLTLARRGNGRRLWGVAAQVYALRGRGDGGIGDATAVQQLAVAAARRGADAVALSPIHSLFAADPSRYSPYAPSSRLFLNPLLADPAIVFGEARVAWHHHGGGAPEEGQQNGQRDHPEDAREDAPLIDWPTAAAAKFALFDRLFEAFEAEDVAAATPLAADFDRFVAAGGDALMGHATFEALHARFRQTSPRRGDWRRWPLQSLDEFRSTERSAIRRHLFRQWMAARSFEATQEAATDAGMRIGLIADLAIGMDPHGSHAWSRQADLLLDLSIGAPPDDFNQFGQDWGLVGFAPRALVARGFEPFLATVRAAMRYAGGVRIDHIMGLQRLWLIPDGALPSEGAYLAYPLDDLLRLLALESHRSGAVVIGEDLGTVPPGFRTRLHKAGIAGMDVMWFMRTRSTFRAPARWRSDAVAMTSTHDLPTVAGWWRGADIETRQALGLTRDGDTGEGDTSDGNMGDGNTGDGEASEQLARQHDRHRLWQAFRRTGVAPTASPPPIEAPDNAVDGALAFTASSPAPLMLAPVEDLLGLSEQPNLPGTIDQHPNWRRRLAPMAADLLDEPQAIHRTNLIKRYRS